mgnify:CR=1 FL=1
MLADFISEGHGCPAHQKDASTVCRAPGCSSESRAEWSCTGLLELPPNDAGMHLMGWLPKVSMIAKHSEAAATEGVEVTRCPHIV